MTNENTRTARHERYATTALSIGAVAITATILAVAGGLFDRPAQAEMVGKTGSITAMTTDAVARELLYVIDDRSETLLIYDGDVSKGVQMLYRQKLPELFAGARASTGRP